MQNRDVHNRINLTENGKAVFETFLTETNVALVSKGIRDLVIGKDPNIIPKTWGEFLQNVDSLFLFLDGLEERRALIDGELYHLIGFVSESSIPLLSKGIRDLVIFREIQNVRTAIKSNDFKLAIRGLFQFFDALEEEYF